MSGSKRDGASMEEILASIRAIIREGGAPPASDDDGLAADELDGERDAFGETAERAEGEEDDDELTPQSELLELARISKKRSESGLVAPETKDAASETLAALGAVLVREYEGSERTLEGLVRELLRPMLKDWLDKNLPDIVERMVSREITRITGK